MNKERMPQVMDRYGLKALIATSPANNLYVSGHTSLYQSLLRDILVFTIVPREGEATLIVPNVDLDLYADGAPIVTDVRCYGTFYVEQRSEEVPLTSSEERLSELLKVVRSDPTPLDSLVEVLREKGLEGKAVGLDGAGISHVVWATLERALPTVSFRDASGIFREIRMVKTPGEIELLKRSAEIAQKAVDAALAVAKEGVSELDLAREFEACVVKEGARPFTVIGCGSRSAFPNARPTNYRIKRGDFIRFDCGCEYRGYYSDVARMAVVGRPSEKQKKYYLALLRGTAEAIETIEPGVKASDLFRIAVESVKQAGITHYRRHHCGHAIGLELYEMPVVRPEDRTPLEEGAVLNIETPYYEIGFGGPQVEHTVEVTGGGARYLTTFTEELQIV